MILHQQRDGAVALKTMDWDIPDKYRAPFVELELLWGTQRVGHLRVPTEDVRDLDVAGVISLHGEQARLITFPADEPDRESTALTADDLAAELKREFNKGRLAAFAGLYAAGAHNSLPTGVRPA